MLKTRWLERVVKGFANHNRLSILELLDQASELSVGDIAERLKTDFKNTSQHLNKMAVAGLVMKRHEGPEVRHKLTDRGEAILKFLRKLE